MFRIRRIQLSVHFTFLLSLAYTAGWLWYNSEQDLGVTVIGLAYVLAFFACVVLHELGHAFAAQQFGVRVRRILLLPIGGMAEMESIPRQPYREVAIALAGPAVNFAIALLYAVFLPVPSWAQVASFDLADEQLFFVMNLGMGLFNLVPAFPMDGGRILRAALARRLPYLTATFWAVSVGKVIATAAAIWLFSIGHYMGGALAVFIFIVGELEYRMVRRQEIEAREWARWTARAAGVARTADVHAA